MADYFIYVIQCFLIISLYQVIDDALKKLLLHSYSFYYAYFWHKLSAILQQKNENTYG